MKMTEYVDIARLKGGDTASGKYEFIKKSQKFIFHSILMKFSHEMCP